MKKILLIVLVSLSLYAKNITPSDVYTQAILLQAEVHYILENYGVKHNDELIAKRVFINANLKPRNVYQKTYEIMIKVNILRETHNFVAIEPVNIAPTLYLNPDLVYEQVRRLLTELSIFEIRSGIKQKIFKPQIFKGKTPLDVFNTLSAISSALDELIKNRFTPSHVYAENMRVQDDLTNILNRLHIKDDTIPSKINQNATPNDTFSTGMKTLEKIKQLQILSGIEFVDFSAFKRETSTPSEVFTITQMIIAELQTLKAYLGIEDATVPAYKYENVTPVEVNQLMNWNFRKLNLIRNIVRGK